MERKLRIREGWFVKMTRNLRVLEFVDDFENLGNTVGVADEIRHVPRNVVELSKAVDKHDEVEGCVRDIFGSTSGAIGQFPACPDGERDDSVVNDRGKVSKDVGRGSDGSFPGDEAPSISHER